MILNLEAKKAVDSSECLGVVSGYSQLGAMRGILCLVGDLAFQSLHGLHPWRDGGMDKHGNGKVALGKPNGDHRQMLTNSLAGCVICGFVALYLDSTAVCQEMEMMGGLLMTKAHSLIAAGVYAHRAFFLSRRTLLGYCARAQGPRYQEDKELKNFHREQTKNVLYGAGYGSRNLWQRPSARSFVPSKHGLI